MEFTEQEKMELAEKYKVFQEEMELAMIQNCIVECELYSLLAAIIRGTKQGRKISLRDVTARRKTKLSKWLLGKSGFPDFVVVDRVMQRNVARYGCIEAKRPYDKMKMTRQIRGHIASFKKVLYTDGLVWKFYDGSEEPLQEFTLGCIVPHKEKNVEDTIAWKPAENWYELMGFLEDWDWTK